MTALPKRRISSRRKGKRRHHQSAGLKNLSPCPHCGSPKPPHRACPECGKYRS